MKTQPQALRHALDWIDSIPSELPLPAMPGFDRDWVESMIAGDLAEGDLKLDYPQAMDMVMEWIDAVPLKLLEQANIAPFSRASSLAD